MNKKYLIGLLSILAIGFVAATLMVNSFVITTDISEPFTLSYAIIDDSTNCGDYSGAWVAGTDMDIGSIFAGETKIICVKIVNAGSGNIDYTFSGTVTGDGDTTACETALGNPSITGTAAGSAETKDSLSIIIPGDTPAISDCTMTMSVVRG